MSNVENIYPANDFSVVAKGPASELEVGIIMGYDSEGVFRVYGGGMLDGKQPVSKDWLWMVETFKLNILNGDYNAEEE